MLKLKKILKASGKFGNVPDEQLEEFIKSKGIDNLKDILNKDDQKAGLENTEEADDHMDRQ